MEGSFLLQVILRNTSSLKKWFQTENICFWDDGPSLRKLHEGFMTPVYRIYLGILKSLRSTHSKSVEANLSDGAAIITYNLK